MKICAICYEPEDRPCVGGLTGRKLSVKHGAGLLNVLPEQAQTLQRERADAVRRTVHAPPRRSDNTQIKAPARKGQSRDWFRYAEQQRQLADSRGIDSYTSGHQEFGCLTIKELLQLVRTDPEQLKRRDR